MSDKHTFLDTFKSGSKRFATLVADTGAKTMLKVRLLCVLDDSLRMVWKDLVDFICIRLTAAAIYNLSLSTILTFIYTNTS